MRRALLLVPVVAATSAVATMWLPGGVWTAIAVGVVLGLGAAALLSRAIDRRVDDITSRVQRFARGETPTEDIAGTESWRSLAAELAAVGATLRQRYDELAEERERGERLLDAMPTAILLFDGDGLDYANPVAQEMLGVARAEASRSPLQILGVDGLAEAVAEVRETGRSLDIEVEREDRHLSAHAALTGEGVVALIVTDDTDARRLEAVRRDFVTNASHELKTPAAGMQALADSLGLAIDRDPERARSMIIRLQTEASRLATLVRDLLDLARLEEDAATQTGRQRVDLAEIVRIQAERLAGLAVRNGVKMRVDANEPAPLVALPGDLRLIAANLLENALRYNQPGGHVDVRVHRTAAQVVLEVADNGIGIPEAERDRVFERFYRVDKARSRAVGGTGLGLSIVRHAVERHGGEVAMSTVLGEGTVFRVTLPVEGAPSPAR
jgi:signal transduction histidine kinase